MTGLVANDGPDKWIVYEGATCNDLGINCDPVPCPAPVREPSSLLLLGTGLAGLGLAAWRRKKR